MFLHSESFQHGHNIPARYAFGKLGTDGPFAFGDNVSPSLAWGDEPVGSKSFAVVCIDNDVPSCGDDVNQSGRVVPADLPRVAFTHWLLVDLPANLHELAEGACGQGVVARGKQAPPGPGGSRQGLNDFTAWFQGDTENCGKSPGRHAAHHPFMVRPAPPDSYCRCPSTPPRPVHDPHRHAEIRPARNARANPAVPHSARID